MEKKPKQPLPEFEIFGRPPKSENACDFLIGVIKSRNSKRAARAANLLAAMKGMVLTAVHPVAMAPTPPQESGVFGNFHTRNRLEKQHNPSVGFVES